MNEEVLKELQEIKKLLQVIASNQEQVEIKIDEKRLSSTIYEAIRGNAQSKQEK